MSFLINPYVYAAAAAGSWTPASLPGLQAWYDADQQTEADGFEVVTLVDRSGNGHNGTGTNNPVTGARPTLQHNVLNGKKVLRFAAANAVRFDLTTSLMNGATAGFYGAVAKVTADPSTSPRNGPILGNFGGAASRWPQTDGTILEGFGLASPNHKTTSNPSPALTSARMYSAQLSSGAYDIYLDGTSLFTSATATVSFGSSLTKRIGSSEDLGNSFSGDVAEVVICNQSLSTSDRQKLEGYYAHKYALTANLPGGHPYISSPP